MFKASFSLAVLLIVSTLAGCGGSDRNTVNPTTGIQDSQAGSGSGPGGMMGSCPADMMKDVTVSLSDTDAGINVDFVTTNTGKLETIRVMVQNMASMHSGASTGGSCCATGGGMMGGTGGGMMGGTGSGTGCGMHGGTGGGMMGGGTGGMMGGSSGGTMGGGGTMAGNCPMMGGGMSAFTNATVTAADIDNGARLSFAVKEGGSVETLRTAVHSHFDQMKNGQCSMTTH